MLADNEKKVAAYWRRKTIYISDWYLFIEWRIVLKYQHRKNTWNWKETTEIKLDTIFLITDFHTHALRFLIKVFIEYTLMSLSFWNININIFFFFFSGSRIFSRKSLMKETKDSYFMLPKTILGDVFVYS